jgi:hypothetical protein
MAIAEEASLRMGPAPWTSDPAEGLRDPNSHTDDAGAAQYPHERLHVSPELSNVLTSLQHLRAEVVDLLTQRGIAGGPLLIRLLNLFTEGSIERLIAGRALLIRLVDLLAQVSDGGFNSLA